MKINVNFKESLYKKIITVLVALIITFFFLYTIFSNIFTSSLEKANIAVTATADHNVKSGGSDIRIVRILLDGQEISFDSIQKDGE